MATNPACIRAGAAQLRASTLANPAGALADIQRAIEEAADQGVELLVLPECAYPAYCLGSVEAYRAAALIDHEVLIKDLGRRARRHGMHLVCGFVEDHGGRLANAAVAIDRRGEVLGVHRKSFLWGDDNDVFAPGETVEPIKTRWGKIGILICADVRAPEMAAALANQGARLICVPTCWVNVAKARGEYYNPQPHFLIEARAREFAVPFVCANKFGQETETIGYCGMSLIVDHRGQRLAEAGPNEAVLLSAEVVMHAPAPVKLSAEVKDRLERPEPPLSPEAPALGEVRVSAVPTCCLLPLAEDEQGRDVLQALAAAGTGVVATTLPDEETGEKLGVYARAIGMRLVGFAQWDRVVSEVFGSYACVRGEQVGSYATVRARALDGAAIVFVTDMPDDPALLRARAVENRVFVVGTSQSDGVIIGPDGALLARCDPAKPEPIHAVLDLRVAADKTVFPKTNLWTQRRLNAWGAAFGRRPARGVAGRRATPHAV